MKKLMITAVIVSLCGATMSYAQTTSSSAPKPAAAKEVKTPDYRYSERVDNNSMLFSKEAVELRRKNLTEPDTVVKEGSGSAPKNTKNHTGTTGNYRNLATQTSGVPSRE